MVSPVREKRAWPPRDRDADGESVAAFEAAVAVVKETVVRSGEVLVSAKEDLSDHQRWLKAQTEAVQADRDRHERWLLRQRERQEALVRREEKHARRRASRQAAMQAVRDVLARALSAVGSAIWSAIGKIVAGLNYLDASVARGLGWIWQQARRVLLRIGEAAGAGLFVATRFLQRAGLVTAHAAQAAASRLGGAAQVAAHSTGRAMQSGAASAGARLHGLAPRFSEALSSGLGRIAAGAGRASRIIGPRGTAALQGLAGKTRSFTQAARERLDLAFGAVAAKAQAVAPSLVARLGPLGSATKTRIEAGMARFQGVVTDAETPLAETKNRLSLPLRMGGVEPSRMLIIGGTVLLICGALMLGGGLMLRSGTLASSSSSTAAAEAQPEEPIAWLFDHKTLAIDERAIFLFETTPDGLRIKGFSIGGVNMSEAPISNLGGVVKPDLHDEDLKLDLIVEGAEPPQKAEAPADEAAEASQTEAGEGAAADSVIVAAPAPPAIPPEGAFHLVFEFPTPETPQDVLKAAGGLLLKVHYDLGGARKSFIQYLPAALLEEQLGELQAAGKEHRPGA